MSAHLLPLVHSYCRDALRIFCVSTSDLGVFWNYGYVNIRFVFILVNFFKHIKQSSMYQISKCKKMCKVKLKSHIGEELTDLCGIKEKEKRMCT